MYVMLFYPCSNMGKLNCMYEALIHSYYTFLCLSSVLNMRTSQGNRILLPAANTSQQKKTKKQ